MFNAIVVKWLTNSINLRSKQIIKSLSATDVQQVLAFVETDPDIKFALNYNQLSH